MAFAALAAMMGYSSRSGTVLKSRILIKKRLIEGNSVELKIEVSDGTSLFSNIVHVDPEKIKELVHRLNSFKTADVGGVYDLQFGEFGSEHANGGFLARLQFQGSGKLNISTHQQSGFHDFAEGKVASEAKLYLESEPTHFKHFITDLHSLCEGTGYEAILDCI